MKQEITLITKNDMDALLSILPSEIIDKVKTTFFEHKGKDGDSLTFNENGLALHRDNGDTVVKAIKFIEDETKCNLMLLLHSAHCAFGVMKAGIGEAKKVHAYS